MIDSATFVNVNGYSLVFNDDSLPFREFQVTRDYVREDRQRGESHGLWPAHTYMGGMLIHVEGDILRDTSTNYVSKRLDMMRALAPRPHIGQKRSGTLTCRFTGMTEDVTSQCSVESVEIPMQALAPARSPYMVNWRSADPRFYGVLKTLTLTTSAQTINNAGNIDMFPTLVLTGPLTGTRVSYTNPVTGVTYIWGMGSTQSIASGVVVTANFQERSFIALSTMTNYYDRLSNATWFTVEASTTATAWISGGSGAGTVSFRWNNAYLL